MDTTWNKPAANRSMPPASIIPVLVYDDVPAAISWVFSQSIADMAPEDWGGTTAKGVKL